MGLGIDSLKWSHELPDKINNHLYGIQLYGSRSDSGGVGYFEMSAVGPLYETTTNVTGSML